MLFQNGIVVLENKHGRQADGRWEDLLRIVLYGERTEDTGPLKPTLRKLIRARREWPVLEDFTGDLSGFLERVQGNPYLIMLAVVNGPKAPQTIRQIKASNPRARLIWYSDHDYALYSYGVRVTSFGLLPVSPKMLGQAMDACGVYMEPPTDTDIV